MTTKNFEFDFDLQMFAEIGDTVDTGIGTSDNLGTVATIKAVTNKVAVDAGWAMTDTGNATVTAVDGSGTATSQNDSHTDTFVYYAFSSTDTSSGAAGIVTLSTTEYGTSALTAPPSTLANTLAGAQITVTGGSGNLSNISLSGIGQIAALSNQASIGLSAGSNLSLTGVANNGTTEAVILSNLVNDKLTQNINGAAINASILTSGGNVTIDAGANAAAPTLTASGAVSLGSINTLQTWVAGNTNTVQLKSGIQVAAVGTTDTVLVSGVDSAGSYLAVTAGENVGAQIGVGTNDTISFNGRTLINAGHAGAILTNGNDTLITANVATQSSLSAGTVGGMASLAAGATATITGAASVAAITAVDSLASGLASGGRWTLGSNLTTAQLGSDTVTFTAAGTTNILTADSVGTAVAGISSLSAGNVTLAGVGTHSSIAIGSGSANWGYTAASSDTVVAVFDTVGSMSLGADVTATVNLNSNAAKTLGVGTNDSLSLNAKGRATVASGLVTGVDSLAASGQWTVKGGSGERSVILGSDTFAFQRANNENTYGVLTAGTNGTKAVDIDDLSGNVTVTSASIPGLTVVDNTWSISGAASNTVVFDSLGTGASVTAQSDLTVAATNNASVAVSGQSTAVGGKFNGVTVATNDSDSLIVVQLEGASDTVTANLAGITSLNSAATIVGDNYFKINDVYTVQNAKAAASANTKVSINSSSSQLVVESVASGDSYTVTGGNVAYNLNSLASGGNTAISINGAGVAITAAGASNDATVYGSGTDAVMTLEGVNIEDTIKTSSADSAFTVRYNVPASASLTAGTSDTMVINNVTIRADEGNLSSSTPLVVTVSESNSSSPRVTITGLPTGESSTVTVSSGVYNVGSSAAVTINESVGYLYIDTAGNVTAEDNSVADVRKYRDESLKSLASSQDSLGATVNPFEQFYNIYSSMPSAGGITTVAGYTSASVSAVGGDSTVPVTSGVNIYGDTSLNAYPEQITLQSYLSNPIAIKHIEGVNASHTVRTAVVDARGGSSSIIALGMDTSADKFATNHTIYGSNRASTIMVGPQATGNHMVRAGSVGSYLYHNAGGQGGTASIFGGTGNDTIIAEKGDHVEGGSGADVFFDSQSYEISDYRPEEGDLIVATKLSATASEKFSPDNLVISGNTVAIAGGSTITIGSNYDEATATRAAITDAGATTRKYLIWAGTYESTLDASSLDRGIMMISSQNGGAADTVIGSASADTVYAGGNDSVNAGAGNDIINLKAADTATGQRGATVALSAGRNEVIGWQGGFANDEGANVLQADAVTTAFRTRNSVVTATNGESVMNFTGLEADETGAYRFIVGDKKVTFIGEGQTATVSSNDNLANIYKADKAGAVVVTSDVTTAFTANLADSTTYTNISSVNISNGNRATVIGSSAAERITLSGARDTGAHKSVMSGGGNDIIVSGGINSSTASLIAGNHFFFGTGNYSYSSGRDTIQGFNYYTGKDSDPDGSGADVLHLGNTANFTGASVMSSRVEISLGDSATVVISDTFTSAADKVVRATFDNLSDVYNVKFGVGGTSLNNFTYDGETNYYWGNEGRSRDTLNVASNLSNVNIWLDNKSADNVYYKGIGVINASSLTDTKASLVGNYSNSNPYGTTISNTIIGGGAGTQSSLWGGGGESNSLVGGDGYDEFFYVKSFGYTDSDGNRHGSKDYITNVTSDDLIRLYDVTLDDIDLENTNVTSAAISVSFKEKNGVKGGSLTVTGFGQETNFKLADGSTYKAVVRGNNIGWE